jgi:peptidoglycan/LPS O-acetylase OafA/YrhL
MTTSDYRPEIDGLRALAVLSVVIFHAGVDFLSGGFIGVDIFYVISGFLITRILMQSFTEQTTKPLSLSHFYSRRLKRLLPAALVMVVITLIFGATILSPNKYIELAKSAAFSNLFMANIWFMKNSGYFDISTQISPLVHMWSLSIEEQFYLLYPALLIVCAKINGISSIKIGVIILFLVSLAMSIYYSAIAPDFSFYMLPTRAWELALGALVALYATKSLNSRWLVNLLSVIAVIMMSYSLVAINHNDIYPGYLALIPTIATAIIIASLSANQNWLKFVLTLKPVLFIGKISYSVYLWHWPIVVYYRIYINERSFNLIEIFSLIVASLVVGAISWKFIEERYRYVTISPKQTYSLALKSTFAAIVLSCCVYFTQGFSARVAHELTAISDDKLMWKWTCTENIKIFTTLDESFCVVGKPWHQAKKKGIVWGDSHSQHWAQVLHYQALHNDIALVIAPRKCPAYLNQEIVKSHYPKYPNFSQSCTLRNQMTIDWLTANPDVELVILASAWSGHIRMLYTEQNKTNYSNLALEERSASVGAKLNKPAFELLLKQISGKQVLLLADIPRPNKVLNECAFTEQARLLRQPCDEQQYKFLNSKTINEWHFESDQLLEQIADEFDFVDSIIPTNHLCDQLTCQTYLNQELIYKDANHIRRNLKKESAVLLAQKIGLEAYFKQL